MNNDVIATCAVIGSTDIAGMHPDLPITPEQIANAALEAREAGVAFGYIHVRDSETG